MKVFFILMWKYENRYCEYANSNSFSPYAILFIKIKV